MAHITIEQKNIIIWFTYAMDLILISLSLASAVILILQRGYLTLPVLVWVSAAYMLFITYKIRKKQKEEKNDLE